MPLQRITGQPYHEALLERGVDGKSLGVMAGNWLRFVAGLAARLEKTHALLKALRLQTQAASIASTAFDLPSLAPGLYQVTWYARITRAATVSSELTVTIGFTDGVVAQTFSGALLNGNTTGTWQSETKLIRIDEGTTITYATTYASVGATAMQYQVDFVVSSVPVN